MMPIAVLAGLAVAQALPPLVVLPSAPRPPTEAERITALRKQGFSDTAISLIREEAVSEARVDPAARNSFEGSFRDLVAAVQMVPFDASAFERIFRARQTALDAYQQRLLNMRFALLRRLSASDQVIFARTMLFSQVIF